MNKFTVNNPSMYEITKALHEDVNEESTDLAKQVESDMRWRENDKSVSGQEVQRDTR